MKQQNIPMRKSTALVHGGIQAHGHSQGDLFANLKRTKLYEKRQTVLTSATVPLLLLFLLLVVDYVFFWGFVHNIQFQLECLPKLGEVAKLVQECGARVQGRNGTDTESLLVISDRLQVRAASQIFVVFRWGGGSRVPQTRVCSGVVFEKVDNVTEVSKGVPPSIP